MNADLVAKSEITERLRKLGRDRAWLAGELQVSEGVVNQWLSAKGVFPRDRVVAVRMLLDREENPARIGDAEGNLISFTIEEFERIEATRQSLQYNTRPQLYRDAIIAFVEADEAAQDKVVPMDPPEMLKAAETPASAPVKEQRRDVMYDKPKRGRKA